MASTKNQIIVYATKEPVDSTEFIRNGKSCEEICQQICKELNIIPTYNLLFSIRIADSQLYLPGCRTLKPNVKYEFRLRYQMYDLSTLQRSDKNAYNYFYLQVKYDLINEKIPELKYSKDTKNYVVGLCLTSMYVDRLENKIPIDDLKRMAKKYVPGIYLKKHPYYIESTILSKLKEYQNINHDSYYAKSIYLEQIKTLAPSYLEEHYIGHTEYLEEQEFRTGMCAVDIRFSPFHKERPGLSLNYLYRKEEKHISTIDDIYIINIDNDKVFLEMLNLPTKKRFFLQFNNNEKLESFVSCISGYYRLMVKWTFDLCASLKSPLLEKLKLNRCHGPIGGIYSYTKLQNHYNINSAPFIIRQCEKEYNTYFIDIVTRSNKAETFQIIYENNKWHLHIHSNVRVFECLKELARSIETESKRKDHLYPSDYEKTATLLLCAKPVIFKKLISQDNETEMRQRLPRFIDLTKEIRVYSSTKIEKGIISQIRADWLLPNDKKLEVTLKQLNSIEHLNDFMQLTQKWSSLQAPEIIKMYGFTFTSPHTIVFESHKFGPLDELLRRERNINHIFLIEAAYTLARALHYLQENNIIHGNIRCNALQVVKFDRSSELVVRLGDHGFHTVLSEKDQPWIAIEFRTNFEKAKYNLKAELWAYATTLWEIFSNGEQPTRKNYIPRTTNLRKPEDCSKEIYDIMCNGWHHEPDQRISPQRIMSYLVDAKHNLSPIYISMDDNSSTISNGSSKTVNTERSHLQSEMSYVSNKTEETSLCSEDDQFSIGSDDYLFEHHVVDALTSLTKTDNKEDVIDDMIKKTIELNDGALVTYSKHNPLGHGNYGTVYKGEYEKDSIPIFVAIKQLKQKPSSDIIYDFQREIDIMKKLNHENIVKIISWIDGSSFSIIMEYLQSSFLHHLQSNRPKLTTIRLLEYAKDIANGMKYLVSMKIIHRDLAARNILVSENECLKISDFGLSQLADGDGYYLAQKIRYIPFKWYAPECLKAHKYSYQSDVWSYGVTLHEVFSYGAEPFFMDGNSVVQTPEKQVEFLESGQRYSKPNDCDQDIYDDLLMECWRDVPKERPSFDKILNILDKFIAKKDL